MESEEESVEFKKEPIEDGKSLHPSGVEASSFVRIRFDRLAALARHNSIEVVERNKEEEVIITTNLLMDLANSRRFYPSTKGSLLLMAGLAAGIFLGYLVFQ